MMDGLVFAAARQGAAASVSEYRQPGMSSPPIQQTGGKRVFALDGEAYRIRTCVKRNALIHGREEVE
jgi:hypothetical protein